jgi:chalcone isomerase-like protein
MPDTQTVNGTRLLLNGIGLRTYSVFYVHVYVAGLYLVHRSDDPESILQSPDYKLLSIRFLRDVTAEEARTAWRDGFEENCKPPCNMGSKPVQEFLEAVRPLHKGDEAALLFTPAGVAVTLDRRPIGRINDPNFAELILSTFIGQVPPTPRLKRELLGSRR